MSSSDFRRKGDQRNSGSPNVDTSAVDGLNKVIESSDVVDTVEFIKSPNLAKILNTWSYFNSVNEHGGFTKVTNSLAKFTEKLLGYYSTEDLPLLAEAKPQVIEWYKDILHNHMKIVYRSLTNNRNPTTLPILRMLQSIIKFHPSTLVTELLNAFDFNIPVLPKLLVPGRDDYIRAQFIKFWITLNTLSPYHTRKDLLINNYKIMNNLYKHIATDTPELLTQWFDFLFTRVLSESTFKKSTKCKIINDNAMFKIQSLIDLHPDDTQFRSTFDNFVATLTSDFKLGVCFANNTYYKEDSSGGVPITANGKTFRIHNKLLFSFLKSLKPWESNPQLNVAIQTLKANQELVIPYLHWILQSGGGYHEPNLSSWWIGHTLFYSQILTIPIPEFSEGELITNNKLVVDMVSLPPLSKTALVHCLDDKEPPLIRQLTLQLIILTLQRLSKFLPYTENKQELISLVFQRIPELSNIIQVWQLVNDNEVMKLSCSTAANLYESVIPTSNNAIIKLCNNEIQKVVGLPQLSGWDLANLDNCLSIQFHQADQSQLKWYSSTPNSHSLFTNLLKLAATAQSNDKFLDLVSTLVEYKGELLFNQETLCSVVTALFKSFSIFENGIPEDIAKLLDELIGRSIKTPYKYTDLSHTKYHDVSMFVVVLMEQTKFVKKDISDWLGEFIRSLIIVGESQEGINKLVGDYLEQLEFLDIENIKSSLMFTPRPVSENPDFVEYVLNDAKLLTVSKRIITSDYDLCALLLRLKLILTQQAKDELIIELGIKMGQYLSTSSQGNSQLKRFISSERFWGVLFPKNSHESNNAKLLMGHLLNEIFSQIENFDIKQSPFNSFIYSKYVDSEKKTDDFTKLLGQFSWVFTTEQVQELLLVTRNQYLIGHLLNAANKLHLTISGKLIVKAIELSGNTGLESFAQILESRRINLDVGILELTRSIVEHQKILLQSLCNGYPEAIDILVEISNTTSIQCLVAEAISSKKISTEKITQFMEEVSSKTMEAHQNGIISLNEMLDINCFNETTRSLLSVDQVFGIIDTVGYKYCFTPEFARFVSLKRVSLSDPKIRTWKHKSMLYITKKFAESEILPESFDRFLESIKMELTGIWELIPTNILNTQLEVILSHNTWIKEAKYLKYVTNVLASTKSKKLIDFEKLLQIFVNNESNVLNELPLNTNFEARFASADIVKKLFAYDESKNSTSLLQENILLKYLGSLRYEDLVLKEILKKIESKISRSWMTLVSNWEFSDVLTQSDLELVTIDRLLLKVADSSKSSALSPSFVVNLNKNFVLNTINFGKFDQNLNVAETNKLQVPHSYESTVYDREFLQMLIISNEELVKVEDTMNFDVRKMIDSGLLQFIVTCLSDPSVKQIAIVILSAILKSLMADGENTHKDLNVIQVYIANILNTVKKEQFDLAPVAVYAYGNFLPILANPTHFLYEKCFRYVLSNPTLKASNGVPLFRTITTASTSDSELSENDESYYRQLSWLIQTLSAGSTTAADVGVLQRSGVLEWLLNLLTNNEYIQSNIVAEGLKLLANLQTVDSAGDLMITRFAIVTSLHQLVSNINIRILLTSNERELASLNQTKLNIDQLNARFDVIAAKSQRLRHWASDDLDASFKRIHTESQ